MIFIFKAWHGMARPGEARQGTAWQGKGVIRSLKNGIILKQM